MLDADDMQNMQKEQRASAQYYRKMLESLTSAVIAVDAAGVIQVANPAACAQLHRSRAQLSPGMHLNEIEGGEAFWTVVEELRATRHSVSRREITISTPDGPRILGMTASLLEEGNDFAGVAFVFTDLTRIQALKRAAAVNRQLAQIGALTAGVVHEFRNPLSVISGMGELLMRHVEARADLYAKAEAIVEEAGQLERLVGQFLSFAKPFELSVERCAPEEILERAMRLCERPAAEKEVALQSRFEGEVAVFRADYEKASRALANIIRNAIDVLKAPGGAVTVVGRAAGEAVVFRVEDTGPGLDLAEGEDLFEPFFSKKEGGTGLGLSIVHRIVTAHGGSIQYGNRDEAGAWFEVSLPCNPSQDAPIQD